VTGKPKRAGSELTDAHFAQLTKAGFTVSMTLEALPDYAVRGVVEDALEGKADGGKRRCRNQSAC